MLEEVNAEWEKHNKEKNYCLCLNPKNLELRYASKLGHNHSGNNPIRGNDEWRERGDVWSFQAMFENSDLEGQRPMPDSIITVAEFLQSNGYKTGMVGKWGLGAVSYTHLTLPTKA